MLLRLTKFSVLCLLFLGVNAQTSHIGGIINSYAAVSGINYCTNKVAVDNTTGFAAGEEVLMIQMRGADIVTVDNPSYGDITNYNGCGNYEVNVISNISGNEIEFTYAIKRNYEAGGQVQLVSLPHYHLAIIDSALKPKPWDGTSGGVVLLQADSLVMNDSISVKGKGFQGAILVNETACINGGFGGAISYSATTSICGGLKGEGVATSVQPFGRGKNGSGGGGGNDHNAGGGGGSNYGAGGKGGTRNGASNFSCPGPAPGEGGAPLTYNTSDNRIFMGGGGGAGDENNSQGSPGAPGGGIVMIIANVLVANNQIIKAGGDSVTLKAKSDAAGGGGAGGTVMLFVNSVVGNLTVDLTGGRGGNLNNGNDPDFCFGPGGGGGGGALWLKGASLPGNVTVVDTGGLPGRQVYLLATSFCPYGSTNGALRGNSGATLFNASIPYADVPFVELTADACCDTTICPNSPVILTATGTATYTPNFLWSNGNTNATLTQTVGATTSYTVTVSDHRGCNYTETLLVTVLNGVDSVSVCCDTTLCAGGTVSFTTTVPAGVYTYQWSTGQTTPDISQVVIISQVFTVTVTDVNNCSVAMNVSATAGNTTVPFSLCCDTTVCAGAPVTLTASSAQNLTYIWSSGQTTNSITVQVNGSEFYIVTAIDVNGCTAEQSVSTLVNNNPPPFTICCDTTVCTGAVISAAASSAQNLNYVWSSGETTAAITQQIFTPQVITVTATDVNGCTGTQSITADINSNPPPVILCCDTSVCSGSAVSLSASSTPGASFSWSTGQNTADITPSVSSTQTISVTVTDANSCIATASVQIDVPFVQTNITAVPDTSILLGQSVQLSASGSSYFYTWSPPDGLSASNIKNPIATPQTTTTYCVTATDQNNCTASDCYQIELLLPEVKIPDAFTPNGDGNNDYLELFPLKYAEVLEVRIYNRWGEVVFYAKGNAAWDGVFKGKVQQAGSYVCSVFYTSSLTPGKTKTVAKDIVLIR